MNNKEFIAQLATKMGFTQTDTQQMVRTLISEMKLHLEDGDTIQINGFGSFEVKNVWSASSSRQARSNVCSCRQNSCSISNP